MDTYFWIEEIRCKKDSLADEGFSVTISQRIGDAFEKKGDADLALVKYLGFDRDLEAIEADGTLVVGYAIHESEPDEDGTPTFWGNVRCWSFDRRGYPIMGACTNSSDDSLPFAGRTKETCPFEPGDKVLVYDPCFKTVEIGLVKKVPPSVKYAEAFTAMTGKTLTRDSDTFTIVYPDATANSPYPSYLFPIPQK